MRKLPIVLAALGMWLGLNEPARAGLYNTAEEERPGFNPLADNLHREFQDLLARLKKIALPGPQESTLRKRYLLMSRVDTRGRSRNGDLSVEQRIDLGAYMTRLGKYKEALDVLEQAKAEAPRNFMVLSNLATAYQLSGHPERAEAYMEQALSYWPKEPPPGFDVAQLERNKKAEELQLKLVRLRAREALTGPAALPENVDDLFGVKFVGDSGAYEAGKLSAEQQAKLPDDARRSVEQLLIWMPSDQRLYWLWGELLNAHGKVAEAYVVLNDLVDNQRWNAGELREHRRVLQEWRKPDDPKPKNPNPMIQVLTWAAIGAAAGVVITLLVLLQIREIRRRKGTKNAPVGARTPGNH